MSAASFFGRTDDGHFLEIAWDVSWSAVTYRSGGDSGWARIIRSSGGDVAEGSCRRIHKCSTNPCTARWPASKYGMLGPPIHVQEVSPSDAIFGPVPPESAPLRKCDAPPAAKLDPQWRMSRNVSCSEEHELYTLIVRLAREIRRPRAYVGYSFFRVACFVKKVSTHNMGRQ